MAKRIILKWGDHRVNAILDTGLPDRVDTSEIFGGVTIWNEGRDRPSPPIGGYRLISVSGTPVYRWEGDR